MQIHTLWVEWYYPINKGIYIYIYIAVLCVTHRLGNSYNEIFFSFTSEDIPIKSPFTWNFLTKISCRWRIQSFAYRNAKLPLWGCLGCHIPTVRMCVILVAMDPLGFGYSGPNAWFQDQVVAAINTVVKAAFGLSAIFVRALPYRRFLSVVCIETTGVTHLSCLRSVSPDKMPFIALFA